MNWPEKAAASANSLTQFIDKDNLVFADSRAGVVLEQPPPLEVFTLHALSVRENTTSNRGLSAFSA